MMQVRLIILLGLGIIGLFAGCHSSGPPRAHTKLDASAWTLRHAFNTDSGRVRVLTLVSPTCGVCLRGAAAVQQRALASNAAAGLRAYVVWVPKLGATESDVPHATRLVQDPRATHYWDASGVTMTLFRSALGLSEDAWDVYLIYDAHAKWPEDSLPVPNYWMHQLGSKRNPRADGPWLDGRAFGQRVAQLANSGTPTDWTRSMRAIGKGNTRPG
jgi:hypothetical protein